MQQIYEKTITKSSIYLQKDVKKSDLKGVIEREQEMKVTYIVIKLAR